MRKSNNPFLDTLNKQRIQNFPVYCTGYPEIDFLNNYVQKYEITPEFDEKFVLNGKNFSVIIKMGFDALSLWDFRRGKGGYIVDKEKNLRVDGWGRIYKNEWYSWDGVFKDYETLENWAHLNLPSQSEFKKLKKFLHTMEQEQELYIVLSLPGLFEKTWQSIGFIHFSKLLKNKDLDFIKEVASFFSNYVQSLIKALQAVGASIFLIADDIGYKKRLFIPKELWKKLFTDEYKAIIELIHSKKDGKVIIHSDGYITDMVGVFIELGFDGIQSLEPTAGVDIFSLFEQYRNRICFIGNLDVSNLLSFGTPSEVKKYVDRLITQARKYGSSLVISPTQQILSSVQPENVNKMIQTAKEHESF